MKLPAIPVNLPFKHKKIPSAYYLTLTIGKEKADAVVFEETLKRAKVVGHGTQYFNQNITTLDDESLLNFLDKAISTAEKNLPENMETHETIFGVDPAWVESGKIKKDYLLKLKKISEDLDLKPIGFIVTTEAIAHLIQKEEGAPVSAILTEIGKKYITATLLRGGRVIESNAAEIGESAPETLDRVLKNFSTPEVLPSRIILFGENTANLNQEFTSFSWSKTLPFLHLPQITPLEKSLDSKAVLYGAASQMSFLVTDVSALANTGEEISDLAEVDIDKVISKPQENNEKGPSEEIFGFVEGEDVSKNPIPTTPVGEAPTAPTFKEEISEIPEELQIKNSQSKALPANALLIFSGLKSALPKLKKYIKLPENIKLPIGGVAGKQLKLFLLPGVVVLILLIFVCYFLFFRSAVITLSVTQKNANKTTDVTFSPTSSTDASSGTIKGTLVSVSEDGKLSTPATGKKQTGDKAKGTVTIFNNNDSPQTLSSGTVITSSNNLNYTLDQSITMASQSGDEFTGTKPGTTNVTVTASNFGTDYNLPSDTKFTIAGTDSIVAKNDNAFSGGTTKNITVVSADDLNKLTADTISSLQNKQSKILKVRFHHHKYFFQIL